MKFEGTKVPKGRVGLQPGEMRGLNESKPAKVKMPKSSGIKPPRVIAQALGIDPNQPIHAATVGKLLDHPNQTIANAAKKMLAKY